MRSIVFKSKAIFSRRSRRRRIGEKAGFFMITLRLLMLPVWLWSIGALYYSNLPWSWTRTAAAWILALTIPLALIFLPRRNRTMIVSYGCFLSIAIWYILIPASNRGDWRTGNQVLPFAVTNGDNVTINRIRDYDYRSENDFKEQYESRTYDIRRLRTLDILLSYWDNNKSVAHMMLSFGFDDGNFLAVSVETRLKKGQVQGGLPGFFKQYGVICILADERDLIRLRTDFRGEKVYLYRLKMEPEEVRLIFKDILRRTNTLISHPKFYNTLTFNCVTSLIPSLRVARTHQRYKWDYRVMLNGLSDHLMWERGLLIGGNHMTFEKLKEISLVNQYLSPGYNPKQYSRLIRTHLDKIAQEQQP